jgi:hypothetical protein
MERNEFRKKRRKLMEDNQKFSQPPSPHEKMRKKKTNIYSQGGNSEKEKGAEKPIKQAR